MHGTASVARVWARARVLARARVGLGLGLGLGYRAWAGARAKASLITHKMPYMHHALRGDTIQDTHLFRTPI